MPWRVIEDEAGANAFAQAIQSALRPLPGWTSISGAIDFCTGLLLSCGYVAHAAGDRHLGRRRQQRRPAGDRGARRRRGRRRHHQRPADHRGRAEPGTSITATTSSADPTHSSWSRATAPPSVRRCCASCWSRSPAFSRPTQPESTEFLVGAGRPSCIAGRHVPEHLIATRFSAVQFRPYHNHSMGRFRAGLSTYASSAARTVAASSCLRYGLRIMAPAAHSAGSLSGSGRNSRW